jgi:hypothetical protein
MNRVGGFYPAAPVPMNSIQGLTSAAYHALDGLDRAIRKIDQAAYDVASAPLSADEAGDSSVSRQFEALVDITRAKSHARANARVFESVDSLFQDFLNLSRK